LVESQDNEHYADDKKPTGESWVDDYSRVEAFVQVFPTKERVRTCWIGKQREDAETDAYASDNLWSAVTSMHVQSPNQLLLLSPFSCLFALAKAATGASSPGSFSLGYGVGFSVFVAFEPVEWRSRRAGFQGE
jgi:hypothetical protein